MTAIRADVIEHTANAGKVRRVLDFARLYQECAAAIAAREWRTFWETGKFGGKYANCSAFNDFCGAAPAQMARAQVSAMLESFISNRANDFADAVQRSSLSGEVKHMLHTINRRQAWHSKEPVLLKGEEIPADVRRLALTIFRGIRKRHSLPNARGIAPVLDTRAVTVTSSKTPHADLWASFKFRGQKVFRIPFHVHGLWRNRGGKRCNVLQIIPDGDNFSVRMMTDMTEEFEKSRAAYEPRMERLGIDFGLCTLIASDRGDMMGRGFLDAMRRIDTQLVGIARHRQRVGEKPRDSERYCGLVNRVRGILKTRINAALNRLVDIHHPAEIVVERLDFRMPGLSGRLNRIITNCGRGVFAAKLADLAEKFGITVAEVNPAYTSQECDQCGFVDRGNRPSQSEFRCLHCGHRAHADVKSAKVVTLRRSRGLDFRFFTRGQVLAVLRKRFSERQTPGVVLASSGRPSGGSNRQRRGKEAFIGPLFAFAKALP